MIDGKVKRRATLLANEVTVIEFSSVLQVLNILCMTENANIAYKINSESVVNDDTTNYLSSLNPGVELLWCSINKIALISDVDAVIQWSSPYI